uniref:Uncharacterized protein n=1 Tax=Rhizophora mucronata TaxID=61149 RepID=A0A2P2NR34_RHIMU
MKTTKVHRSYYSKLHTLTKSFIPSPISSTRRPPHIKTLTYTTNCRNLSETTRPTRGSQQITLKKRNHINEFKLD